MLAIDNILISDEIVESQFVCNLAACKGGCCVDGDCGAPLEQDEIQILADIYPVIKTHLDSTLAAEIERQGTHVYDNEYGAVTPTINGGICAYGITDAAGVVKCGIEAAWEKGIIDFRKPISCHLFPIRISLSGDFEMLNYEPRETLCDAACVMGSQLKVPVYRFLQEPLTRKYGTDFFAALEAFAARYTSA